MDKDIELKDIQMIMNNNIQCCSYLVCSKKYGDICCTIQEIVCCLIKNDYQNYYCKYNMQQYIQILINNNDIVIYNKKILNNDIERIIVSANTKPSLSTKKIIIIMSDDFDKSMQNKLLKTIEEPPQNTYFILCVQNINNLIQTIVSRCIKLFIDIKQNNNYKLFMFKNLDIVDNVLNNKNIEFISDIYNKLNVLSDIPNLCNLIYETIKNYKYFIQLTQFVFYKIGYQHNTLNDDTIQYNKSLKEISLKFKHNAILNILNMLYSFEEINLNEFNNDKLIIELFLIRILYENTIG